MARNAAPVIGAVSCAGNTGDESEEVTATVPVEQGGYLRPGHWQFTTSFRHQYSFRHFIGTQSR